MKIKMLSIACGADFNAQPGQIITHLPDEKAQALVDGGYARKIADMEETDDSGEPDVLPNFEDMKPKAIEKWAEEHGIELDPGMKKPAMIDAIMESLGENN